MLKRPWWMFLAAAGIAAVIGLMSGGGMRTTPGKSNESGRTRTGPVGIDRMSGASSKQRPANPTDDETENSVARESSRHAAGEVERDRPKQNRRKIERLDSWIQAKEQLRTQLGSLLKYEDDQLAVYAAGLDLPDNPVQTIYPKYLEAMSKLEDLQKKGGLGDAHPTVKSQKETLDGLKRELDEGVVKLRGSLTAQIKHLEDHPPKAAD